MSRDTRPGEDDVPRDDAQALSRATGGIEDPDDVDQGSTTGSTDGGEYVGRIAGQDVGYAEEQGGERRVRWEAERAAREEQD